LQYALVGLLIFGGLLFSFKGDQSEKNNNKKNNSSGRNDNNNNNNNNDQDQYQDFEDSFDDPSFEYFKTKEEVKTFLGDYEILARTLYGECRSCEDYELKKIALVILNRLNSHKFPNTIKEVCLQKKQFSVWNELYYPNKNYLDNSSKVLKTYLNDYNYNRCLRIAKEIVGCYPHCNDIPEVYNYILNTDQVMIVDNKVALSYAEWSVGMIVVYKGDDHIFLKESYI
jgi:hypothetical protein